MSDDQNDSGGSGAKGLVTITSDNMQALNTSGTNEIVPPDSPKKGHLILLRTTVASDGEMEIQRTLVEEGENNDFDENNEVTGPVGVQPAEFHRQLDGGGHLESAVEHKNEVQESQPPDENPESNQVTGRINSKEGPKPDVQEPIEEHISDVQESNTQSANFHQNINEKHQEVKEEYKSETIEASPATKDEKPKAKPGEECEAEVQAASGNVETNGSPEILGATTSEVLQMEKAEIKPVEEATSSEVLQTEKAEVKPVEEQATSSEVLQMEKAEVKPVEEQATSSEVLQMEKAEVKPVKEEEESAGRKSKPKRTMTLPTSGRFALPWQKKHVEDDSAVAKSSLSVETPRKSHSTTSAATTTTGAATATATTTSTTVIVNPLSGVMKSLKKGFKIKVGGSSKSGEDPAPGRIPQKSGSRPSPRIVSSLNITPAHQPEVAAEPDSPSARRRKEIEEILNAMPPSPTPSMDNLEEAGDASGPSHIYDNLLQGDHRGEKTVTTPSEEEICPSVATKVVLTGIGQTINQRKAANLVESMTPEPVNGNAAGKDRPPRPQPAKNEQTNSSKSVPRHLPPPPRPVAPPKVTLQKSYTLTTTHGDQQHSDNNVVISPVTSPSPLQATAPVQMRPSYADTTTSLDRRRLYRSKAENRIVKQNTLSRPMTMHETTFTVKRKHYEDMNKSFDESTNRSKSQGAKIVYEQKDTITLPKFLLGSKKKSAPAPVSRPQLAATPTNESEGANALRSIATPEGGYISPTVSNAQYSMPPIHPIQSVSVGVQTVPQRPKAPISSLRHGASPLKSPPASPPVGNEIPIPSVGERIVKEVKKPEEAKSSLFAFQHSHKVWHEGPGREDVEESASEKLVNRCLQEYMAACCRLRSVDLQGEFAAFHWQYGDLADTGWVKKGVVGHTSLEVYNDPSRHIDFVKLPPIQHSVGSLIYPQKTIDSMLATWIDIGQTQVSTTPTGFGEVTEPVFHPAFAIIRLSDLLEEMFKSEEACQRMRPSLALAVLLSIDQCSANLPQSLEGNEKLFLNLNPAEIILLSSPANCLVIFRITDSEGDWNIQRLLLELYQENADSLQVAMKACFENLSKEAKTKLYLPTLLEAVAPPDWVVQTIARIALGKGEDFSHSQGREC